MLFRTVILRHLRGEPARALVTLLGVALGVAVVLGIRLTNESSVRGFDTAISAVSGRTALEISGRSGGLDERFLSQLHWLRDYGIATPIIEADATLELAGDQTEMLRVLGIDALRDPALRDYQMSAEKAALDSVSPMQLLRALGTPNAIILTEKLAARHSLRIHDSVSLALGDRAEKFIVSGLIADTGPGKVVDGNIALMDIAAGQMAMNRAGRVDRLDLRLHEGLDTDEARAAIAKRLPPELTVERPARRSQQVEKMLAAFHFNLTMLSSIALVVGVFLIYNTISVSVITRRREIGMLRMLGVTKRGVLGLFLSEALVLAVPGALLGTALSGWLAKAAVGITSTTVSTLYVARAAVVPPFELAHLGLALAVAIPLALLAAAVPAREASSVQPMEAMGGAERSAQAFKMRPWQTFVPLALLAAGAWAAYQPAVGGLPLWGYFSAACAILGVAFATPAILWLTATYGKAFLTRFFGIQGRLAAAEIAASTHRLSVSVATLAVSLALTLAIAIMVGSFRQTVLVWVSESLGANLYIRPAGTASSASAASLSPDTIAKIRSQPEVVSADVLRSLDVSYGESLIKVNASRFQSVLKHGTVSFKAPADWRPMLDAARLSGDVMISESLQLRNGLQIGDSLELPTRNGPQRFRIVGINYDYSNDRGTVTMDEAFFQKHFGELPPLGIAVYLKPGSDAERVRENLLRDLGPKTRLFAMTSDSLRAEVLRIFDSTFAITWALEVIAVLVAIAGIATTMLTLVLERRKEIALLRIAGAEAAQVRGMILIESGLLGIVCQFLGLIVGFLLSLVLIHVINPQSFGWSIQFHCPWMFLIASTVITITATSLAGLYPAWRATRQPPQPPSLSS